MSNRIFWMVFAEITCIVFLGSMQAHGQKLSDTFVTAQWKNVRLVDSFDAIQNQTGFFFTYSFDALKNIRVKTRLNTLTVGEFLQIVSAETLLEFRVKNDIIYVFDEEKAPPKAVILLEESALKKASKQKAVEHVIVENTARSPGKLIHGLVLDENNVPLEGATVKIKGSGMGIFTNSSGRFSLSAKPEELIEISFVGYQNALIKAKEELSVKLQPDINTMNEVLVIGYGSLKKERVTGSSVKLDNEELNKYAASSFEQQLVGKAAGVFINENGGPGTNAQIVIRGINTLTAGSDPLIVVDGLPLTEGSSLNSISPKDIASIVVLKDAASAAIYGSRAANGVILVNTKEGVKGKPKLTVDFYQGVQQAAHTVKLVNAQDAATFFTEARDWGYVSKSPEVRKISDDRETRLANGANRRELRLNYLDPYLNGESGLTDTNWLNAIFQESAINNIQLAFSGGSESARYYISASLFHQKGVVIGSSLDRKSTTIKFDSKLSDYLTFGINLNPSLSNRDYLDIQGNWSADPLSTAIIMYPFFSIKNADGSYAISEQIKANTPEDGALGENIVAIIENQQNQRVDFRTFGNAYLQLNLLKGLHFKTSFGGDYRNFFYDYFTPSWIGAYRTAAPKPALAKENTGDITNYQIENLISYKGLFGQHAFDYILGQTFQKETGNAREINGVGIPDDNIDNIAGASSFNIKPYRYAWSQLSYLSRLQYAFADKYLFSAAVRKDGSSRFGHNARWGTFPAFSAGWILSKEPFFENIQQISFAKVKASWGQSGNNQIGSYSSKALVTNSDYVYGDELAAGVATTTAPNANLSWETNSSLDLGLDLGFLTNKLNLSLDYYISNTSNLLLNVPVPEQSGFSEYITNIGKVQNRGFELSLEGQGFQIGRLKCRFNGNFSTNANKVLALAPGQQEIRVGTDGAWRTKVGRSIAEMWGYQVIGVYKTQEEINSTAHLTGTLTGDYIMKDLNKDGLIDDRDRLCFGTYNPKITYGFTGNFNLSRFDFSFAFNGIRGRTVQSWDQAFATEVGEGFAVPSQYYFDHRYHPVDNPNGFLAQPNLGNFSAARRNSRTSSVSFMRGDYLRLRNLQLGYNLPEKLMKPLGLAKARIYLTANNLLTLTKFRGWNPDGSTRNALQGGYQKGDDYPISKSLTAGLSFTL
ncbi:TonB-dependent receptor [Marinilongibacter aquaticus]|uniref:SusC/RagA family TonB-linked outer membrane protein n=1 Tax=Marinilongibacter aquaticus TaxID=2975157 RepID=UPI0021BD446E|nr:TonB-dependent receptor [Marinilongibacter aquaticus]UBM58619.1 TonB-dependent receptor [Marinilongibacter aquaticus]